MLMSQKGHPLIDEIKVLRLPAVIRKASHEPDFLFGVGFLSFYAEEGSETAHWLPQIGITLFQHAESNLVSSLPFKVPPLREKGE